MRVHTTGYLGQPGHGGHLDSYERQFLAMTMVPLGN